MASILNQTKGKGHLYPSATPKKSPSSARAGDFFFPDGTQGLQASNLITIKIRRELADEISGFAAHMRERFRQATGWDHEFSAEEAINVLLVEGLLAQKNKATKK